MAESVQTVQTTARKYLKGSLDNTIRKRPFFRYLEQKSRVQLNANGADCYWLVEYKENTVQPYGAGGVLSFSPSDNDRQLNIDVRGYKATDEWHEKDRAMNTGDVAIIERYDKILPRLAKAMRNTFCGEFWIDGNLAANANRLHGTLSFMGDDGNTVPADKIANPSDTYAGRSTALANLGGSWSSDLGTSPNATAATDWPFGNGDSQYDYLAPKLVNYSSTNWGTGGSTTWEDNCERALRFMVNALQQTGGGDEGMPDCHHFNMDLFTDLQNHFENERRLIRPSQGARDLGLPNAFEVDGVACHNDFDVPAGIGYTINFDQVTLFSLMNEMFFPKGPIEDIRTASYLFSIGFYGNMRWNPKHHGRLAAYA